MLPGVAKLVLRRVTRARIQMDVAKRRDVPIRTHVVRPRGRGPAASGGGPGHSGGARAAVEASRSPPAGEGVAPACPGGWGSRGDQRAGTPNSWLQLRRSVCTAGRSADAPPPTRPLPACRGRGNAVRKKRNHRPKSPTICWCSPSKSIEQAPQGIRCSVPFVCLFSKEGTCTENAQCSFSCWPGS